MIKKWKLAGEIKETRTLAVSGSGGGLYLFLPKEFCELYEINGGDKLKVTVRTHYKRDYSEEEKGERKKAPRGKAREGEL